MANRTAPPFVPGFDEFKVVEAARHGDQEALTALYEEYFPKVYRYIAARLPSTEDVEDVTEEIFLKIVDHIGNFAWRGLPFGAWVFRIARNELVSHVRRQKHASGNVQLSEMLRDHTEDHTSVIERQFVLAEVREATERLPEAQRQVIALRFGAGLSVAETAQALKKSENNVKVLQHKAIAKLQLMVRRDR